MRKKLLCMILASIFCLCGLGTLAGCEPSYVDGFWTDMLDVMIFKKYEEDYKNQSITIEDFNHENIKEVEYLEDESSQTHRILRIHLKKRGVAYRQELRDYLYTLDFVQNVGWVFTGDLV